jgi:TolA-binding protein
MQGKALQDAGDLGQAATAYASAFSRFAPEGQSPPGAEEKKGAAYYAYRAGLQAARVLRMTKDKVKESDAAYQALLERFPKPKELDKLFDEWALLNYEAGNYQRSDEIFRRLVEQTPDSELADNARLSLAESELIAGKVDSARKSLLELASHPKSDQQVQQVALSHLIGIAVERKQWKEVQETAARLTSGFPESKYHPQAEFYRGEAQLQLGDVAAAQETLLKLKAEVAKPEVGKADWFPRVWVLLAETYQRMKKYDDVARTVEEFRAWDPQSLLLYQADEILGRSLKNQAKFDEALAAFRRAIAGRGARRTETAAKSQFMIAEIFLIQKNYETALKEYLMVYHLYKYPDWQAPALYQAALCDEVLNEWDMAVQAYEDLLKDFPESEYAAKAKKNLPNARRKAAE